MSKMYLVQQHLLMWRAQRQRFCSYCVCSFLQEEEEMIKEMNVRELALEVLGNVQHVGVGVVAFTTHDGRMVLEADDLQQHISDGGVDVVQQRH